MGLQTDRHIDTCKHTHTSARSQRPLTPTPSHSRIFDRMQVAAVATAAAVQTAADATTAAAVISAGTIAAAHATAAVEVAAIGVQTPDTTLAIANEVERVRLAVANEVEQVRSVTAAQAFSAAGTYTQIGVDVLYVLHMHTVCACVCAMRVSLYVCGEGYVLVCICV